jgi:MFS family permease
MTRPIRDHYLLFAARGVRALAYGQLAVILGVYLAARGFTDAEMGALFTATLLGDAVVSLGVGIVADRFGRRRMLVASSLLIVLAGVVFALSASAIWLTAAAIIGTISPSGADVGPFAAIEQSALAGTSTTHARTRIYAHYQLVGALAAALGAISGGAAVSALIRHGLQPLQAYRSLLGGYAVSGLLLAVLFALLSSAIEVGGSAKSSAVHAVRSKGLHRSRRAVYRLCALFAIDSFGSGLAVQSFIAYYLHRRFGADTQTLGSVFFFTNIVAGCSALLSPPLARRFGLLQTMVWTHIPANICLLLFPFMPNLTLAIVLLLLRFATAQMDVPARTSYVMALVDDDERSATTALTSQAKLLGASLGPLAAGILGINHWPFLAAGLLKIAYDLALYRLGTQLNVERSRAKAYETTPAHSGGDVVPSVDDSPRANTE